MSLIKSIKRHKTNNHNHEKAFSYISALVFVTVIGISLTVGGAYWSTAVKREKEKELLFRGDQIRSAIEFYYKGAPGNGASQYPASLNDLLKDPRYLVPRRYLRKIYKDPMTEDGQWGFVTAPGGRIKGVFSKSKEQPLKTGNFTDDNKGFEKAEKYSDWRFVYPPEIESETDSTSGPKNIKTNNAATSGSGEDVEEDGSESDDQGLDEEE